MTNRSIVGTLFVVIGAALAAFIALFISISIGTFTLNPDASPGSRVGDILAFLVGALVFVLTIHVVIKRGFFRKR